MATKKNRVVVYLDNEQTTAIKEMADNLHMSMSGLISTLLTLGLGLADRVNEAMTMKAWENSENEND